MSGPTTVVPLPAFRGLVAEGAGLTHRGRVRSRNEDAILTDPAGLVWAVADGMGGYGQGDVAADIVIDHIESVPDEAEPVSALVAGIRQANAAVRAHARQTGTGQMGATVAAVMIVRSMIHVAWAGDSRVYLLRGGRLRMLTRDHSLVQTMIDHGQISAADAEGHPESHIVTRAVGGDDEIEVDTVSLPLFLGDRILICSDGLTRCAFEHVIADHLKAAATPYDACLALVREALDSGAPDNVSVIVIDMREG